MDSNWFWMLEAMLETWLTRKGVENPGAWGQFFTVLLFFGVIAFAVFVVFLLLKSLT